ncbi:hypothetical protein QR680_012233 [Steinernema hermaphroditum]|uniref:Endonuclease III homolog n=1 Tax=Steinernema hermaphroditum TaxID=289476 RepID=A0AA39I1D3_9BILA|nr:hypothetical protein QR680_012233 [Steinernema hermaphroditum]
MSQPTRRTTRRAAALASVQTSSSLSTEEPVTKKKKSVKKHQSPVEDIEEAPIPAKETKKVPALSARLVEQWDNIKKMRETADAPVDQMGCHMLADPLAEPKVFRFQCLLALMLSSQTKDQVTAAAMHRLREKGCNIETILNYPEDELGKLLCPVGMYKRKAMYIQKTAVILRDSFEGDIPQSAKELCELPGVGPKMAHLLMQIAWNKVEGIGVDTHVHRIVNRLGWIKTSTPEQTRVKLEDMLPREEWESINKLLVGFGQQRCLPVKPQCSGCLNKDICPSSTAKTRKPRT